MDENLENLLSALCEAAINDYRADECSNTLEKAYEAVEKYVERLRAENERQYAGLTDQVNRLTARLQEAEADAERLNECIHEARTVILRGVEIMDHTQVGQWEGVRAWLEQAPEWEVDK